MSRHRWTRDELSSLVAGTVVAMRGPDAEDRPVPQWLADAALGVSEEDSSRSIELTHPEDRSTLIGGFVDAMEAPGEPRTCRIRAQLLETWVHAEVTWLNLLGHPDVEGVLCTLTMVDGPPIEAPTDEMTGAGHSATNWMIVALDAHATIIRARGAVRDVLGYEVDELVGRMAAEFVHPDSLAAVIGNWVSLRQDPGRTRTSRELWVHRDGTPIWLEASFLVDEDGTVEIVLLDIRDRIANEQALAASQAEVTALAEDFRLVADEVPTPVFRCDAEGRIDFRNSQWTETFPDLAGVDRLHDVLHPDVRAELDEVLASGAVGESWAVEGLAADGVRVLSIHCRAVGTDAGPRRFVGSITDITATLRLHHQATHDHLTGLANRSMVVAELAAAIAEDDEGTLVVFIDLDGFKEVNDNCGHEVGDRVLAEVAARLAGAVRPGDLVGRHGGDEFVVICRGVAEHGSEVIVDRLRTGAFSEPIGLPEGQWTPGASIGLARPRPGDDVAKVLRRADEAMFVEKRRRGGRREA